MYKKSVPLLMVGCLIIGLMPGCAWNKAPRFQYSEEGQPLQFKRYPKHLSVDYWHRMRRTAYKENNSKLHWLLTAGQRQVIKENGQPDYLRNFLSNNREKVEEWVYWKEQKLFQFIMGELIFAGPLTDMESVLIKYGYPDQALVASRVGDKRFVTFIYRAPFSKAEKQFAFVNDKIAHAAETE